MYSRKSKSQNSGAGMKSSSVARPPQAQQKRNAERWHDVALHESSNSSTGGGSAPAAKQVQFNVAKSQQKQYTVSTPMKPLIRLSKDEKLAVVHKSINVRVCLFLQFLFLLWVQTIHFIGFLRDQELIEWGSQWKIVHESTPSMLGFIGYLPLCIAVMLCMLLMYLSAFPKRFRSFIFKSYVVTLIVYAVCLLALLGDHVHQYRLDGRLQMTYAVLNDTQIVVDVITHAVGIAVILTALPSAWGLAMHLNRVNSRAAAAAASARQTKQQSARLIQKHQQCQLRGLRGSQRGATAIELRR